MWVNKTLDWFQKFKNVQKHNTLKKYDFPCFFHPALLSPFK